MGSWKAIASRVEIEVKGLPLSTAAEIPRAPCPTESRTKTLARALIPPDKICMNTLMQDYHVRKEDAQACHNVIMKNVKELGLSKNKFLRLDNLSVTVQAPRPEGEKPSEEEERGEGEKIGPKEERKIPSETEPQKPKLIFVAHGKNKKPLEQLRTILSSFKVPFEVAVYEPSQRTSYQ